MEGAGLDLQFPKDLEGSTHKRLTYKQTPRTMIDDSGAEEEIDYNTMQIVIGGTWSWPLAPGPGGFCVAHTKGRGTVTTEVANATYYAWLEGKDKKPSKKRKNAKNDEDPPEEDADAMKKPAAADPLKRPAAADDHATEQGTFRKPAANPFLKKPSAADPEAAAAPAEIAYTDFDHTTQQFGMEWYKKDERVGMRIKGSRQAFSFGGKRCANTKDQLQAIGRNLVQMLNKGEISIADAERKAKESVVLKDD